MTFSEVIKVSGGVFFNVEGHRARMERTSLHFWGHTFEFDPTVPPDMQTGLVKCRVVYGERGVESVAFSPYTFRVVKTLAVVRDDTIDYSCKSTDRSRLDELLKVSECDEIIIVKNGMVTDASFANIVLEDSSGAFFTPSTPLLAGTKREQLLRGGIITEREIRPEELFAAAKIHFINAMVDLGEIYICSNGLSIKPTETTSSLILWRTSHSRT